MVRFSISMDISHNRLNLNLKNILHLFNLSFWIVLHSLGKILYKGFSGLK